MQSRWVDFGTDRIPRYSKIVGPASIGILLYDAERQMRYARVLDHPGSFQLDLLAADADAEMLEQSDTFTEEYRHEVDLYFVKKTRFQVLLSYIRATQYPDVLVALGA